LIYVIDSNPTDGSVKSKKVTVGDLIDSRIYGISSSQFVLITGYYADPSWITSLDWSKITNAPSFVTSLSALTDVSLSSPVPNQLLRYNGTSWYNWTPTYYSLPAGGTTLQYIDGTGALQTLPTTLPTSTVKHLVKAGVPITKGQAVYVTSADGTNMIVGLASNASESTSSKTMGLLDATVTTNGFANVVTEGLLAGLDTTGANAAGDPVWLGTGGNLIYGLVNKPYAPNHLVFIGIVTRRNANNGEIFVKVQNGFELSEIHDVDARNPDNNDGIFYNSTTQLWEHKQISSVFPTPTLASVTTAGNTTTNSISTGNITASASNVASLTLVDTLQPYAWSFRNNGTNLLFVNNGGTNIVKLTAGGNVLVGTNTDSGFKLDVNGDTRVSGSMTVNNRYLYHQGNSAIQYFMISNAWSGTNSIFFGDDSSSTIGAIIYNHQFDSLAFTVNGTNALHINSSRNIGIGTTSPTNAVHIRTAAGGATSNYALVWQESTGDRVLGYLGADNSAFFSGALYLYQNGVSNTKITANGTSYLMGGNVLVGTTTDAGYKLDVNGTGRFTNNLSIAKSYNVTWGTNQQINITDYPSYFSSGYNVMSFISSSSGSVAEDGSFVWRNAGTSTNLMILNGLGRLGLGTSNPTYKLEVFGGIRSAFVTTTVVHGEGNTLLLLSGLNGTNPGVNEARLHIGYNQNDPELRLNSGGIAVSTGKWTFLPQIWFAGGITSSHNIALTIDGMSNGVTNSVASEIIRFTQRGGQFANFYDAGAGLSEFRIWQQANSSNYIYLKPGQTSYFSSGNLVIGGTTDAGYKLDVLGTTRAQVSLAGIPNILHISNLQTDAGPGGAIAFYTGGYVGNASRVVAVRSGSGGQSDIGLETSGVTRLFVAANSGNVGIGTTTDGGYKLNVTGNNYNTFVTNAPFLVDTSANNYRIANLINNPGYHTGGYANNTFDIFSVGANSSSTANGSPFFRVNLAGGSSTGYYGAAGQNQVLAQLNGVTTATLVLSAQGSGMALIGSTSINPTITTIAQGSNLNLRSDVNGSYAGGGINYFASINGSNHSHVWYFNSAEQMRLMYTGNLLLGTATDSGYRLDVNGTARVGATGGSGQLYIKGFAGTGQYIYLDDGATVWSLLGGGNYSIQENGINRFTVRGGGNVGIGTTTPAYKLQVGGGDIAIDYNRYLRGGGDGDWNLVNLYNGGTGDIEITMLNVGWYLRHNANATFAGNVGIGTTIPSAKLDVSTASNGVIGIFQSSVSTAIVQVSAVYENKFRAGSNSDNSEFWYDAGYATTYIDNNCPNTGASFNQYGDIRFRRKLDGTNLSTVMTIRGNNGNVGIGTTTPFGKLDVKDGEIFVTTSTNANLRSRLTYQGLYVSRSSDGGYPEQIISTDSAWQYHSRNKHTLYIDTIPHLQIGHVGISGLNIPQSNNIIIGNSADNGAKLQVKGSGSTSATNSLLITNSSGTESLKVQDDNVVRTTYLGIGGGTSTNNIGGTTIAQFGNAVSSGDQLIVVDSVAGTKRGFKFGNQGTIRMALIQDGVNLQIGSFVSTFNPYVTFEYVTGNVGFGTTSTNASAKVQIDSTTQGFLPPRLTSAQRTAISSPAAGLCVFDTDLQNLCFFRDGVWVQVSFAAI